MAYYRRNSSFYRKNYGGKKHYTFRAPPVQIPDGMRGNNVADRIKRVGYSTTIYEAWIAKQKDYLVKLQEQARTQLAGLA